LKHTIRFVSQHYYRFRVLRLNPAEKEHAAKYVYSIKTGA
jgi:hypothetical protein